MNTHLCLQCLDERIVPYVLSGYSWADHNVTTSIIPDGTPTDYGAPSNMMAVLDHVAPRATWQGEYARALATWAEVANINFRFVPDDGSPIAIEGPGQGDPRFGDIRLGGYPSTLFLGEAYFPGDFTLAGDTFLNTDPAVVWHVGQVYDLYSTFLHETGHALGLEHSLVGGVMWPGTSAVYPGLYPDDIAGIQAIYGPRVTPPPPPPPPPSVLPDAYEPNDTEGSAWELGAANNVTVNGSFHTATDHDWYRAKAPHADDYRISATSANAVTLIVRDAGGNILAAGGPALTVHLARNQVFTVEVYSPAGELFTYQLTIQRVTGHP